MSAVERFCALAQLVRAQENQPCSREQGGCRGQLLRPGRVAYILQVASLEAVKDQACHPTHGTAPQVSDAAPGKVGELRNEV